MASLPRGYRVVREGSVKFYSFNNGRYRKMNGFFVVVLLRSSETSTRNPVKQRRVDLVGKFLALIRKGEDEN